jgi:hypothetical protein
VRVADAAFNSIKAKTARREHERVVYAWLEETRGLRPKAAERLGG